MENYCECEIYYKTFKDVINHFSKQYGEFLKMKNKNITKRSDYNKEEALYTTLNQIIKSLPDKGNNCISYMKKCKKGHKKEIEEITTKLENNEVLGEKIEDYHKKIINELPEEFDEESDEDEKEDNNNVINKEDEKYEIDEKAFEKVDVVKTMKNDQKNIKIIYNLLENEEVKAKRDEEKRDIIKLKNQLDDVLKSIEVELNRNDEQIDDIEERVDNGLNQVVEGNDDNLEKAAISAVKRRRLAYQGGLALTLGAIGSVVPGIGNAIGLAAGGLIGYGLYRIDKHRLKKALKKKKKIREEKDNK